MKDLTIQFAEGDGKCLYQQIYEHIRDEIRKGELPVGEKLPSTRSLAEYLQVARSTVDAAYGQLVAEGYLEARPCRGYFVAPVEGLIFLSGEGKKDALAADRAVEGPCQEQGAVPGYGLSRDGERGAEEENRPLAAQYDFSPHAVSLKDFPFATWKKITRNILVDANSEMFALGDAQGDLSLRETIVRYLHSSRGVNCLPEQVIVGAGNDYLLMLLEKILGRFHVALEEPTYRRAYRVFSSFASGIEAIPVDEWGMDVERLRATRARVAYVMPSHQYPTGVVMPIGRRMELLGWAGEGEKERYIIEDDYDSEFRYRGKPIPALQASDVNGRVIYVGTFSKSIAPAIRVGYMVLPGRLLARYRENCGFYASTVSRIDQRILNEFIRDGYFERYLNRMRKIYRGRHDFLLGELSGFEREFAISGENAGLHLLLSSRRHIPEETLLRTAAREGVKLYGISQACMTKDQRARMSLEGTVLMGYGALEEQALGEGIRRLKKAWSAFL